MKKVVASSILAFSLLAADPNLLVLANASPVQQETVVDAKPVTEMVSSEIFEPSAMRSFSDTSTNKRQVGQLEDNGWYKQDGSIDKEKLKEAYLNFFSKDATKYKDSIENVDKIVEQTILNSNVSSNGGQSRESSINSVVSPAAVVKLSESWKVYPRVTSSNSYVTYATSWLTEDNYRSSVPVNVSYTKSSTISSTIGFTGSVNIKATLGFSAESSASQTTSITQGSNIPAWTVWGRRPYIKWNQDTVQGTLTTTWTAVPGGSIWEEDSTHTGTNKRVTTQSTEYWSQINSSKNTSASTPAPPSGAPL